MEQPASSALRFSHTRPGPFEYDSSASSFAFLVHSQHTIPHNLPPNVDNKPLARQRRRRTSPEDQAVLEAEFHRDSKPDKEARQQIVERVALGEKEVQIWFQNRRQNKRRKSQPLSYEILPRLEPASSEYLHSPTDGSRDASPDRDPPSGSEANTTFATSPSASAVSAATSSAGPTTQLGDDRPQADEPVSQSVTMSPIPDTRSTKTLATDPTVGGDATPATVNPTIETAPSRVRLSMTSSGGARIISGAETTPSPPRSQPLAPTPFATRQTLRRSYSAAGLREQYDGQRTLPDLLHRKLSGRSRDSRAWEFWCDSDARNGLVRKAEQETAGSAADAISLIRSNSGRGRSNVLTPNLSRANTLVLGSGQGGAKRAKKTRHDDWDIGTGREQGGKRSDGKKLQRVRSSVPRLQGEKPYEQDLGSVSPSSKGESEKENREPHAGSPADSHERQYQPRRKVYAVRAAVSARGGHRHGSGSEGDEEVEQFMRGSQEDATDETGEPSDDEMAGDGDDDEMDCVAGLLSLSQGNWR